MECGEKMATAGYLNILVVVKSYSILIPTTLLYNVHMTYIILPQSVIPALGISRINPLHSGKCINECLDNEYLVFIMRHTEWKSYSSVRTVSISDAIDISYVVHIPTMILFCYLYSIITIIVRPCSTHAN